MVAMNVSLTPELDAFVREEVSSGRYASSSEVVRDALRLLQDEEHVREMKLDDLRQAIHAGLESGPAEPWDAEDIKRRGRERLMAARAPAAAVA